MDDRDLGLRGLTRGELAAVERLVRALVAGDVRWLESVGAYDGGADPYRWTRDYGRWGQVDLAVPPGRTEEWDGHVLRLGADSAAVVVDMWTDQEGRSALSLELDLTTAADGSVSTRFRDLHVL